MTEYKPTEEEADAIDRAGFMAAWTALQPIKDESMPGPKKVLVCLQAFKAAREAVELAVDALTEEKRKTSPDMERVYHYAETTLLVCSAVHALRVDPKGYHPRSFVGGDIATLIRASQMLESLSDVYRALDDDHEVFGTWLSDEAVLLSKAGIKD